MHSERPTHSARQVYDGSYSGAQERPWIPRLRSDISSYHPLPHSLVEFRELEGPKARETHLRQLWKRLPKSPLLALDHEDHEHDASSVDDGGHLTPARAKELKRDYESELMGRCHGRLGSLRTHIAFKEFRRYAEAKEVGTADR
jgi:solute carrier family 25 phosphate transporter 23/24/25/41